MREIYISKQDSIYKVVLQHEQPSDYIEYRKRKWWLFGEVTDGYKKYYESSTFYKSMEDVVKDNQQYMIKNGKIVYRPYIRVYFSIPAGSDSEKMYFNSYDEMNDFVIKNIKNKELILRDESN